MDLNELLALMTLGAVAPYVTAALVWWVWRSDAACDRRHLQCDGSPGLVGMAFRQALDWCGRTRLMRFSGRLGGNS